jgi:hypothetical protein
MNEFESDVEFTAERVTDLAVDLARLGAACFRYGLVVGASSLHSSAESLREVAEAMRSAAERWQR